MEFDYATLLPWLFAMLATGVLAGLIAGLLGVGGGIVIVPVLYQILTAMDVDDDMRMHVAVATSLAIIIPTSVMSARAHHQRGSVDLALVKRWAAFLLIGVALGTLLAIVLSGETMTLVFAAVALLVAVQMVIKPDGMVWSDHLPSVPVQGLIATVIGSVSTLMGIGGGSLSVPTLGGYGFPIRRAVGTSAALGAIIALPGALGFVLSGLGQPDRPPFSLGYVNLLGFALIFPTTMLLSPWGARLAHSIPPRMLRIAFALFLGVTAARLFYQVLFD
ncbi:sulfite exporter TauE/SafE family protein [Marinivivus vitaminiproducens]|uniref:sulfite exporter TauE/SafE family protein n=1 Tax=Marinivivus vitaminiproducens TaxID=3035935 RepID=UPI0027A37936|nr:sulfite exporter TauE/SafE family protein [Geminicoccaceae bacterium SCSIO 64248]